MACSMRREMIQKIEQEMKHFPEVDWHIERRKKHWRIHMSFNDQARFVIMPGSPSDHRSIKNKQRDVRQVALALGAKRTP